MDSNLTENVPETSLIRFILNETNVDASVTSGISLLEYLRNDRSQNGTKEGCNEGECGACNVLIGELVADRVEYQPMPACMIPLAELHQKHVVTIEGLNTGQLSVVQSAMVNCGATQCGFCIPGFVVSMTAWTMSATKPLDECGLSEAISGNLCRCTGYRSIRDAGCQVIENLREIGEREDRVEALVQLGELPSHFATIKDRLSSLPLPVAALESDAADVIRIAGGTDLYCQQRDTLGAHAVRSLYRSLPTEEVRELDGWIEVDAHMTFESFGNHPIIQTAIPEIQRYNQRIASWPIRTRATLAGNLCNASPIADVTCLLLALGAELELLGHNGPRMVALEDFYLGYKKPAANADELVTLIRFPQTTPNTRIHWEKISKRSTLDIATVNSAARIEIQDGWVSRARLAFGGVAAIPLLMTKTNAFLAGKAMCTEVALEAAQLAQTECAPISDIRGAAEYRKLLVRQLVLAHFMQACEEYVDEECIYASIG